MNNQPILTKRQDEIVWRLQNGWIFITGQECGAILTKAFENEQIRLDVFFALVKKEIIYQEHTHWNYILTTKGENYKPKFNSKKTLSHE